MSLQSLKAKMYYHPSWLKTPLKLAINTSFLTPKEFTTCIHKPLSLLGNKKGVLKLVLKISDMKKIIIGSFGMAIQLIRI